MCSSGGSPFFFFFIRSAAASCALHSHACPPTWVISISTFPISPFQGRSSPAVSAASCYAQCCILCYEGLLLSTCRRFTKNRTRTRRLATHCSSSGVVACKQGYCHRRVFRRVKAGAAGLHSIVACFVITRDKCIHLLRGLRRSARNEGEEIIIGCQKKIASRRSEFVNRRSHFVSRRSACVNRRSEFF